MGAEASSRLKPPTSPPEPRIGALRAERLSFQWPAGSNLKRCSPVPPTGRAGVSTPGSQGSARRLPLARINTHQESAGSRATTSYLPLFYGCLKTVEAALTLDNLSLAPSEVPSSVFTRTSITRFKAAAKPAVTSETTTIGGNSATKPPDRGKSPSRNGNPG